MKDIVLNKRTLGSDVTPDETSNDMLYGIDDNPPAGVSILLALQHILAAFAGIIAVPLVVCTALKFDVATTSIMVSATILAAGLATFIQSKGIGPVGARVPGMMGTDFTFVNPTIAVGTQFGIAGIAAATFCASLVEIVLSRFIKPLMRFFPPLITGTVVTLIGVTLLPVSMDWAAGGSGAADYGSAQNLIIAFSVMILTLALNHFGKGIVRSAAVFIGMVAGYIVCIPLGMVNLSAVSEASWFAIPNILGYGFHFDLASALAFVPAYIVSTIGTVGIMLAIGQAAQAKVSDKQISGGVLADGVGSALAGLLGAGPNTSFSQNVGLVTLTKVASRRVMMIAGIILIIMGFFPKIAAIISVMPQPVLGGAGVIMFGLVAAQGIKTLATVELGDRELLIVSVALALGIGVTVRPDILSSLPSALQMIFSSGISTGTLAALILNVVLVDRKKTQKEEV